MNTERLRILADHIERLVDSDDNTLGFNMGTWISHDNIDYRGHWYGTVGCIAGHAILLFAPDTKGPDTHIIDTAYNVLSAITHDERDDVTTLFYAIHRLRTPKAAAAALRELATRYEQETL